MDRPCPRFPSRRSRHVLVDRSDSASGAHALSLADWPISGTPLSLPRYRLIDLRFTARIHPPARRPLRIGGLEVVVTCNILPLINDLLFHFAVSSLPVHRAARLLLPPLCRRALSEAFWRVAGGDHRRIQGLSCPVAIRKGRGERIGGGALLA